MKTFKMFLLFLLLWLQYSLWLGKNGILDYIKIHEKVAMQKKKNECLDMRNKKIILEIENFNKNVKNVNNDKKI